MLVIDADTESSIAERSDQNSITGGMERTRAVGETTASVCLIQRSFEQSSFSYSFCFLMTWQRETSKMGTE